MISTLLSHQWKGFWRSRGAGKSLAAQLFMGFLFLYLSGVALFMGVTLQHFLHKLFPTQDVVSVFCGLILYYFSVDILLRFMLQELPVLSIQPYLVQNIRRRQLVEFLNVRSIFHFLNLIPLFLFVPFSVTAIAATHGPLPALAVVVSVLSFTLFNHFLILFIKRKTIVNSWWFLIFAGAIALFAALDYFHILSVRAASVFLFTHVIATPWLMIIPVALAALSYINNRNLLRGNMYLEEIVRKDRRKESAEYAWLKQLGLIGELVALNLKLIFRNKRPRSVAFTSVIFLCYGFIFYTPENLNGNKYGMLMLGAIFVTGIFILSYGQFLFAWHSNYFDGLMSSNIPMATFLRSKLVLFISVSSLAFLLTSFYGFISWKILPIQLAAWLYNIGVNSILAIYLSTYSYKGIDLNKSATFNYQGTGSGQWIFALLVSIVPILINLLLSKLIHPWAGIIFLGAAGLISLLMQKFWINFIITQFQKRKYLILEGFREK